LPASKAERNRWRFQANELVSDGKVTFMDQDLLVKEVVGAAKNVFETMLGLEIIPDEATVEKNAPTESERVVALIGLAGSWIGTFMLCCKPELACKISSLMLMMECDSINEDVLDAMAEMANMIFGNVKTELESKLGNLGLSIPTVIFGRNFAARNAGQQAWTVVPIHVGEHLMEVKFCLTKNKEAPPSGSTRIRAFTFVPEEA